MASRNGNGAVLNVPVDFGGVSIGHATARLGVKISRDVLNIMAADEIFCGHRLTGKVILGNRDDAEGQTTFVETDYQVDAVFDVKRIGVNSDSISTGLTFSLNDIDVAELAQFSKGQGRLIVEHVSDLPDDDYDDDESDLPPGTLKAEGPWRDVPLENLFSGALLKSLKAGGLETVGALADYTASEKRLTDLPGVGPGKAEQIEDRMEQFWADNQDREDG